MTYLTTDEAPRLSPGGWPMPLAPHGARAVVGTRLRPVRRV
ncbi:hypothetical protein [Aeromonas caviae]|nr:hypothetical protein [Aeromonas caviae]